MFGGLMPLGWYKYYGFFKELQGPFLTIFCLSTGGRALGGSVSEMGLHGLEPPVCP
jgi:hypothetical protein